MTPSPVPVETSLEAPAIAGESESNKVAATPVLSRWGAFFASGVHWCLGLVCLVAGLSLLATIPVVQLLSLGYLLEVSGRIARSDRFLSGLIGVRKAAVVGGTVLGIWLTLWPARAISGLWYSSLLINGPDATTQRWRMALIGVVLLTVVHISWALIRGGRLRDFLWPAPCQLYRQIKTGGAYAEARDRFWAFVTQLRGGYYLQLGFRGALGTLLWLFVPITLMVLAARLPVPLGVISGWVGAMLLATVLLYLPYLQTRFAASNRWSDLFDVRSVRRCFARAPIAFWFSLLATLALALPLYLLKAELIPREAVWLPAIVFVLFALPARFLCGWAVARGHRRERNRHFVVRWLSRTAALPVVILYVAVVYFTQYTSWYGGLSLYEQHAFLLPVPFLSGL